MTTPTAAFLEGLLQGREDEVKAIVAWLHRQAAAQGHASQQSGSQLIKDRHASARIALTSIAEAIARGDHLRTLEGEE